MVLKPFVLPAWLINAEPVINAGIAEAAQIGSLVVPQDAALISGILTLIGAFEQLFPASPTPVVTPAIVQAAATQTVVNHNATLAKAALALTPITATAVFSAPAA